MNRILSVFLLSSLLFSCSESGTNRHLPEQGISKKNESAQLEYAEFHPDTIPKLGIKGFYTADAYQLGSLAVLTGYYEYPDGKMVPPNTEDNFGMRLLGVDKQHQIRFQSNGSGDVYLFEPHFYRNPQSEKVYILCQEAFEYYCGASVFLFENDKIRSLGIIDLSGKDLETKLTDIVQINESGGKTIFSFNGDSLTFNPGGENEAVIPNRNIRYIYTNQKLHLIR
ncbi:hypothetical protein [Fluviicola sp.]|uniref:hypothetical protein n=1 Tax=Fluviicola sp. TaxID=1917219 RepID=UPI0031D475D6